LGSKFTFLFYASIFAQTYSVGSFLRAKAATLSARLSHRNSVRPSVRPSVCHTGGSGKNGPTRISKSSPSAAWKTLVSGTVKLFHKFEGGLPERGR